MIFDVWSWCLRDACMYNDEYIYDPYPSMMWYFLVHTFSGSSSRSIEADYSRSYDIFSWHLLHHLSFISVFSCPSVRGFLSKKSLYWTYYTVPNYWCFSFPPPSPLAILSNKSNEESEPRKSSQLKANHTTYWEWQWESVWRTFLFICNPSFELKCTMVSWISNWKLVHSKSADLVKGCSYHISPKGRCQISNEKLKQFVQNPIYPPCFIGTHITSPSVGKFCGNTTKR